MASVPDITRAVEDIVEPIVRELALELVDVELRPVGKRWQLRVYIDKPGGVTIADCERTSRELGRTLEVEDVIDRPYVLEVSSPGLTRALKKREDFVRYHGKNVRVVTTMPIEGQTDFHGRIGEVGEDTLEIEVGIAVTRIPLCAIKKANLEFEL